FSAVPRASCSILVPYTTLFRSAYHVRPILSKASKCIPTTDFAAENGTSTQDGTLFARQARATINTLAAWQDCQRVLVYRNSFRIDTNVGRALYSSHVRHGQAHSWHPETEAVERRARCGDRVQPAQT